MRVMWLADLGRTLGRRADANVPRAAPGPLFMPARWRRAEVLKWLKRTHAWCGFWGGVFGLLFGLTGIVMNHRAVMKLPLVQTTSSSFTVSASEAALRSPQAMAHWLAGSLDVPPERWRIQTEPSKVVPWSGASQGAQTLQQPARWSFTASGPLGSITAEHWVGSTHVSVARKDGNGVYLITRLHMAQGVHALWILVADTIAGCFVMLSLTGVMLWTRLHGPRLTALLLVGTPLTGLIVATLLSI